MRRAPVLLTAAGVLILLASIPATGLGRSSAPPVATSRSIMAIASSTSSAVPVIPLALLVPSLASLALGGRILAKMPR